MARTSTEITNAYLAMNIAAGEISKIHIQGVLNGYDMKSQFRELDSISHLKMVIDIAWPYLDEIQQNQIFDFAAKYYYN